MAKKYSIGLGERSVSPAAYLAALRLAQATPAGVFRSSFRDPRGWTGRSYTGAEIVAQHWQMIRDRWASWNKYGKGNRAEKRAAAIRAKARVCDWCGSKTGGARFCDYGCAKDFYG